MLWFETGIKVDLLMSDYLNRYFLFWIFRYDQLI